MSNHSLDAQLDRLDERFQALAASLTGGSPDQVQLASQQFQLLAVALVQALDSASRRALASPQRMRRIQLLAVGLASVRENLLRQSAYVERALEVVMPTARQKSTYAGNQTYGGPARQSGAFSVLSA